MNEQEFAGVAHASYSLPIGATTDALTELEELIDEE